MAAEVTDERSDAARSAPVANASYLAGANMLSKLFALLFVLYAYRALHKGLMGDYVAVTGYVGLFNVLVDLGLGTLAVRDVSQNRALAVRYISNVLALRVVLSFLSIAAIVVLAQWYINPGLRSAAYVCALGLVVVAVSNTLQIVFQFSERLAYGAVLNASNAAGTAVLGILVIALGFRVQALVTVYVVVSGATALATAVVVYRRFLPLRVEIDPWWWPHLLQSSLPFGALTFINVLYNYADRQILYVLKGCTHTALCPVVGEYSTAYRPLDILVMVFVGAVNAAALPPFTRAGRESRAALARLVRTAGTLGLVLGVPVALFVAMYAPEALYVVGGREYVVAAGALAILIWTFPSVMVLTLLYNALYALHRQSVVTAAFGVTLVFNVALNLLLIPRYSYPASAAITVASEVLNGVIVLAVLRRELGPLHLASPALRVGIVALAAGTAMWLLRPYGGIWTGLPVGIMVCAAGIRISRVLDADERAILGRLPLVGRYAWLLA